MELGQENKGRAEPEVMLKDNKKEEGGTRVNNIRKDIHEHEADAAVLDEERE